MTVKAGDGVLASAGDIAVAVAGGSVAAIPLTRLESARVKVTTGDTKGRVNVTSAIAGGGALASVLLSVVSVA